MATTTDELITKYTLRDEYSSHLARMTSATSSFAGKVLGLTSLLSGLAGGFGLAALGKSALDNALQIERLTGTLTALTGSAERAGMKLDFLQKFARTSIGEFKDLAQAGTLIEAAGLNMERVLPTLSNIAAAFGGTQEQVLELASAFGRLPSGVFGESMEIFRRFGITAGDFMAEGLKISGSGQIKATAEQMLTAIENIAKRKFGDIGTILQDSLGVKISNLSDAWNQMTATFGQTFFPILTKAVDKLTSFINFLRESDFIENLGKSWSLALDSMVGTDGVFRVLSFGLALLEKLPQILSVSFRHIKGVFESFGDIITGFVNYVGEQFVGLINIFRQSLNNLSILAQAIPGFGTLIPQNAIPEMKFKPFKSIGDLVGQNLKNLPLGIGEMFTDVGKRGNELFGKFKAFQKKPGETVPEFTGGFFNDKFQAPLQEIAENTRQIAVNTNPLSELRKFVVGGGPLASIGVTPVELGRARGNTSKQAVPIKVNAGSKDLSNAIQDIVQDAVTQMIRQGILNFSPL